MKSAKWIVMCCLLIRPVLGQDMGKLINSHGFKGGIVVHLGCGGGEKTADLLVNDRCLVHGLDRNASNIEKARRHIISQGVYGRVSVMTLSGNRLPYADNMINLIVAETPDGISSDEMMRVLVPNGTVLVRDGQRWRKATKPVPAEIDEWRQYLHDADNNAVAHDSVVGPPRHLQWVGEPAWSRSHMGIATVVSMVSSGGRFFTIEDRATPENPFLPGRWSLIARDAFNGLPLWRHDFADWEPVTRYIKDIAVQLQRRLAAIGDVVYCTPGLDAPVKAFDAATGKVIRT
ncbi:MAG: class I SAM-dependent methyltransferase, partial [Planctomycetota bacterium]